MKEIIEADRLAYMFRSAREDAGKSQDYMAKALNVSKKTVQNWESGYSSPSQLHGFQWFYALGVSPFPYYLKLFYPSDYGMDDEGIEKELINVIHDMPPRAKANLLYILKGKHGSVPASVLDMVVAHLHVPLKDRLIVASTILNNYRLEEARKKLINEGEAMPDIDRLSRAIVNATEAVILNNKEYVTYTGDRHA